MRRPRSWSAAGLGLLLFAAAPAAAQDTAAAKPPAAPASLAKQLGLFIYPAKQQTAEQQATDERECYVWAQEQTGIDPAAPPPNADSAAKVAQQRTDSATRGAAVGGAARGAAAGAIIGGIAGDAGTGAAIGAASGAIGGRRAKRKAGQQAAQAGAQNASATGAAQIDVFKRSMTACLEGRGYTAK